jgi:hypothetical protein
MLAPGAGAPFRCEMTSTVFGGLQLLASRHRGGFRVTLPAERDRYLLLLSSAGTCKVLLGGDALDVLPDVRGALLSPGQPVSVDVERDYQGRAMAIERGAVDSHFRALAGREPPGLITFAPALSLDSGPGATLYQVAQLLRGELDRPEASPHWLASLRDTLLTSLLTSVRHSASSVLEAPRVRVAQGSVRRAEEFIHAHAGEPIALADIVAAAGVPERSLRAAFTVALGVSPMEYLRQHRLETARRRLFDPTPDTTVAGWWRRSTWAIRAGSAANTGDASARARPRRWRTRARPPRVRRRGGADLPGGPDGAQRPRTARMHRTCGRADGSRDGPADSPVPVTARSRCAIFASTRVPVRIRQMDVRARQKRERGLELALEGDLRVIASCSVSVQNAPIADCGSQSSLLPSVLTLAATAGGSVSFARKHR